MQSRLRLKTRRGGPTPEWATLSHWLAAKHIAAGAPIGLSATNGEATPALTSDLPGQSDGPSTDSYSSRHSYHLLIVMSQTSSRLCKKRRPASSGLQDQSMAALRQWISFAYPNKCSTLIRQIVPRNVGLRTLTDLLSHRSNRGGSCATLGYVGNGIFPYISGAVWPRLASM